MLIRDQTTIDRYYQALLSREEIEAVALPELGRSIAFEDDLHAVVRVPRGDVRDAEAE